MAKSPVYGRGRNRKRNKGPVHAAAANINMKGKKSRVDHCWCCECIDFRDKIRYKEHMKEIERGKDE
jgi:hypothetical protein